MEGTITIAVKSDFADRRQRGIKTPLPLTFPIENDYKEISMKTNHTPISMPKLETSTRIQTHTAKTKKLYSPVPTIIFCIFLFFIFPTRQMSESFFSIFCKTYIV